MSENRDFWKELMGDDFDKSDFLGEEKAPVRDELDADATRKIGDELDFSNLNIEVVNKDGSVKKRKNLAQDTIKEIRFQDKENTDKGPEDFKINFDFEREYESGRDHKPIKRDRQRRTGCLGGILYFVFVLAVSIGLAAFGWVAATDVLALGKESGEVDITLPESMFYETEIEVEDEEGNVTGTKKVMATDVEELADLLYDNGLIEQKWIFKLYGKISKAGLKVSPGSYVLNTNYDYRALVTGMTKKGGTKVEVDITIPEGFTNAQIFELMEENGICSVAALQEAATNHDFGYEFLDSSTVGNPQRLEGYLFPDTYTFYVGDDPVRAISKLLNNFQNKWTDDFAERAAVKGYTVQQIITIASMIEKEAAGDSERATVASVIFNRLNSSNFPHLEIDATIFYAMSLTGEEFSTSLDSPYNTYVVQGLPVGPIANPGLASIRAALYPESTNYYYYALSKSGLHEFFKSYDPFINFVNSDEYGG